MVDKTSVQDKFNLLANDSDFVFDFNRSVPGGTGGTVVAANRKSFPALVGTGASMAVGWIERKCALAILLHALTLAKHAASIRFTHIPERQSCKFLLRDG